MEQSTGILEVIIRILESNLFQFILTAIVSYIVAKMQANFNSKNIDKQIRAELKTIDKQYEYEMKRDNRNYLYKIKLDKSFEVHKQLSNYLRINLSLLDDILELIENEKINNATKASELSQLLTNHADNNMWDHEDTNLIMVYMPDLEEDWKEIYTIDNFLKHGIYNKLYSELNETDGPISKSTLELFKMMVDDFHKIGNKLLKSLREEIRKTIVNLS